MARNPAIALDRTDARHAYAVREALEIGRVYRLRYVKRDGETSSSTGEVKFFNGREGCDTMSVNLDTPDKGPRTINVVGVFEIEEIDLGD